MLFHNWKTNEAQVFISLDKYLKQLSKYKWFETKRFTIKFKVFFFQNKSQKLVLRTEKV